MSFIFRVLPRLQSFVPRLHPGLRSRLVLGSTVLAGGVGFVGYQLHADEAAPAVPAESPDSTGLPEGTARLPFALDLAEAKQRVRRQFQKAFVAASPSLVQAVEDSVQPLYVPCWVLRVKAEVKYKGAAAVEGTASWRNIVDQLPLREHEVVVAALDGSALGPFRPADFEAAGPWHTDRAVDVAQSAGESLPPRTGLIPFGVSSDEAWTTRGRALLEQRLQDQIRATLTPLSSTGVINVSDVKITYGVVHSVPLLLPVYVATYADGSERHVLVVNGNEGVVRTDIPYSIPTMLIVGAIGAVAAASVAYALKHPAKITQLEEEDDS